MSDTNLGKIRGPNGREFEAKLDDWGKVYVREIAVWGSTWDGPSGRASSSGEAVRMAEAFVFQKYR